MERLMKPLAVPPGRQTALHSHSAKSPEYGDISRWLTLGKLLVKARPAHNGQSGMNRHREISIVHLVSFCYARFCREGACVCSGLLGSKRSAFGAGQSKRI